MWNSVTGHSTCLKNVRVCRWPQHRPEECESVLLATAQAWRMWESVTGHSTGLKNVTEWIQPWSQINQPQGGFLQTNILSMYSTGLFTLLRWSGDRLWFVLTFYHTTHNRSLWLTAFNDNNERQLNLTNVVWYNIQLNQLPLLWKKVAFHTAFIIKYLKCNKIFRDMHLRVFLSKCHVCLLGHMNMHLIT